MSESQAAVAIVHKLPFGSIAFQCATAVLEDDGSIAIVYADPEHEHFEETWQTFKPGSWRMVDVQDVRGYPLFSFISPAAKQEQQQRLEAARAVVR